MPFLDVVDPAFDFTSPEALAAQAADWYADSPLGRRRVRQSAAAGGHVRTARCARRGLRHVQLWTSDIGMIFSLAAGGDTAERVERAVAGLDGYVEALIDEKAKRAVRETMRWRPSAASVFRRAAEDFEFRGMPIAAGAFLTVAVRTAQRDPRAYPGGDTFDITVVRAAPLLQFGAGPHYCLGTALAHAELGEALPVLARRFGPPAIDGEVTWRPAFGIHGPNELPLRFEERA